MPARPRVVIKLGTQVVARESGSIALGPLGALVEQIADARRGGWDVIVVTSGAVGLGSATLHLKRPLPLADRQAAAAVGQVVLMRLYETLFAPLGQPVAQVLLTEGDLHHRSNYVALSGAIDRLLGLGVVPVVNQNDVVSTKEIDLSGQVFGDNDRLAALVAASLGATDLLLLTNVDGVFTAPPDQPGAKRVPVYDGRSVTIGAGSALGTGGMQSKIDAARVAARSGVRTVIAHGHDTEVVRRILERQDVGTLFPTADTLNRRRQWIAFAAGVQGRLEINEGAARALRAGTASLLWPGLERVVGEFDADVIVEIAHDQIPFARGRVRVDAHSLEGGIGSRRGVIVHRDDIVLEVV